jgi:hypothetical protein
MRLRHRTTFRALLAAALLVVAVACSSTSGTTTDNGGATGQPASTADTLAPSGATGSTVDGIKCESSEQLAYHIHAHLAIFVNGEQRLVPAGVGIYDGTCIYWLHTHDDSGILHVESPDSRVFTLGNFFAVWQQPLSATQVGPAKGPVTAWVDGKRFTGDPAKIQLTLHAVIQLDVGTPSPAPKPFTFPDGL